MAIHSRYLCNAIVGGKVLDSGGNGYDMTMSGTPTVSTPPPGTILTASVNFPADPTRGLAGAGSGNFCTSNVWSWAFWAKPTSVAARNAVVSAASQCNLEITNALAGDAAGQLAFGIGAGWQGFTDSVTEAPAASGVWKHFAFVRDGIGGGKCAAYVNGQPWAYGMGGLNTYDFSAINTIYCLGYGNDQYFQGDLADVITYTTALAAGDVASLYAGYFLTTFNPMLLSGE